MSPRKILIVNCNYFVPGQSPDDPKFEFTLNRDDHYIGIIYHFLLGKSTQKELEEYYNTSQGCFVVVGVPLPPEVSTFLSTTKISHFANEENWNEVLTEIGEQLKWQPKFQYVDERIFKFDKVVKVIDSIQFLPINKFRLEYIYLVLDNSLIGVLTKETRKNIGNLIFALKSVDHERQIPTPLFQGIELHDKEGFMEIPNNLYQYPNKKILVRDRYKELFNIFLEAVNSFETVEEDEVHVTIKVEKQPKYFLLRGHPGIGKTSLIYYFINQIQERHKNPSVEYFPEIFVCKGKKGTEGCDCYLIDNEVTLLDTITTNIEYVISDTFNFTDSQILESAKVVFLVSSLDEVNYKNPKFQDATKLYIKPFTKTEMDTWAAHCLPTDLRTLYYDTTINADLMKYGNITRHIYNHLVMKKFGLDYWKEIYEPTILNVLAENGMTSFIQHYATTKLNLSQTLIPGDSKVIVKIIDTDFSHYILTYHFADGASEPDDRWSDIVSEPIKEILQGLATIPNNEEDRYHLFKLYKTSMHLNFVSDLIWLQLLLYDLFHPTLNIHLFDPVHYQVLSELFPTSVCPIRDEKSQLLGFVVLFSDLSGTDIKILGPGYAVSFTTKKMFLVDSHILRLLQSIHSRCGLTEETLTYYVISPQKVDSYQWPAISKIKKVFGTVLIDSLHEGTPLEVEVINKKYIPDDVNNFTVFKHESFDSVQITQLVISEDNNISPNSILKSSNSIIRSNVSPDATTVTESKDEVMASFREHLCGLNNYIPVWTRLKDRTIQTTCKEKNILYDCQIDKYLRPSIQPQPLITHTKKTRKCYMAIYDVIRSELKKAKNFQYQRNFLIYGDQKIGKTTLCKYLATKFLESKQDSIFFVHLKEKYYSPKSTNVFMRIGDPIEICGEDIDIVISDNVLIGEDDFSHAKCVIFVTNKYDVEQYKTFRTKRSPTELYIPFLEKKDIDQMRPEEQSRFSNACNRETYQYYFGSHPFPFYDIISGAVKRITPPSVLTETTAMTPPSSSKWNYTADFFIYELESYSISDIKTNLVFRSKFFGDLMSEKIDLNRYLVAHNAYLSDKNAPEFYETIVLYFVQNVTKNSITALESQLLSNPNTKHPLHEHQKFENYYLSDFLVESSLHKINLLSEKPNGVISLKQFHNFPSINCVLRWNFIDILIQITKCPTHVLNPNIYRVFHYLFHKNLKTIVDHYEGNSEAQSRFCNMIGYIPIMVRFGMVKEYEDKKMILEKSMKSKCDTLKEKIETFDPIRSQLKSSVLLSKWNDTLTYQDEKCAIDDYLHYYVNCLLTVFDDIINTPTDKFTFPSLTELNTFSPELIYLVIHPGTDPVKIYVKPADLELPLLFNDLSRILNNYHTLHNTIIFMREYQMEFTPDNLLFYNECVNNQDMSVLSETNLPVIDLPTTEIYLQPNIEKAKKGKRKQRQEVTETKDQQKKKFKSLK